ncbi:hypothetical protein B0A49_06465 [Cryomyces minteri]|uniref:EF-hand domain-containing protein n=1 Tax=Cryomyces minteri TaxID=331657 RepID=A0A4U0XE29_9PEZI|nr:hypothetical protein B0A49_06465 [Cryomyces minteri]
MSTSPQKSSSLAFTSPRSSPFRRPESPIARSPSTVRETTPTPSPTKPSNPSLSPTKRDSPFVRRPSTIRQTGATLPSLRRTTSTNNNTLDAPATRRTASKNSNGISPPALLETGPRPPTTRNPSELNLPSPPVLESPTPTPNEILGVTNLDGANTGSSPSPSLLPSPTHAVNVNTIPRPSARRVVTSSTTATVRPFPLTAPSSAQAATSTSSSGSSARNAGSSNGDTTTAASSLPATQLRAMRESFSVLDRHATGSVNASDVGSMLDQLGLDASPAALAAFFPPSNHPSNPSNPATMTLATYLRTLTTLLAPLSPPTELLAAFAAFDDDDSGQVDLGDLRDALLNTAPEAGTRRLSEAEVDGVVAGFSVRRAFGAKGMGGAGGKGRERGEVFRYREFVGSLGGGVEAGQGTTQGTSGVDGVVG